MDFLKRAEEYAMSQGDAGWFKQFYSSYRENYSVHFSTYLTIWFLYGEDTAEELECENA